MTHRVDRTKLESVFPPGDLVTLTGAALDAVPHQPTREFLRDVGLPDKSWLKVSRTFRRGEPQIGFQQTAADYPGLNFAFERWLSLGHILADTIGVDVASGKIYVRPVDKEPHLLNSSIDTFVYALYLLEVERPNYDFEKFGHDEDDPEAEEDAGYDPDAADRLREQLLEADPVAFQTPDSTWDMVLHRVTDDY
ncbi:SUKH-4 family immunity protein [Kitasatospora sp. GAS1066B]|uniref:SUKH-4 family immunity protein n=1 Tax=Kitasatospora sp. GAS1066B TaxID=3156271 RepID=UPI0035143186